MIKRMDIAEFVSEGYLHELNRQFLHPHGLALEVVTNATGRPVSLGGVWDYREDPGGIIYDGENLPDPEKVSRIAQLERMRKSERLVRVGFWVQPVEEQ